MSRKFCKEMHNHLGHPGTTTFYLTIKDYLHIPKIKRILLETCRTCKPCQIVKVNKHKYGKISGNLSSTEPNKKIYIDHLGPFKERELSNNKGKRKIWFLIITEAFSKYTKMYKVMSLRPEETVSKLNLYFKDYNCPENIISDNGRTFTSKLFRNFLKCKNIKQILISPYNPQSNGLVERRNRIILEVFKIYKFNSIKQYIQKAELKLNHTASSLTQYTPSQLLLKKNNLDILQKDNYDAILKKAISKIKRISKRNHNQVNKGRIKVKYKPGDLVILKSFKPGKLYSAKIYRYQRSSVGFKLWK